MSLRLAAAGYGLALGKLVTLSFQRFATPDPGIIDAAPPSLGALPVALGGPGIALVPLADGEAFWIGLSAGAPGTVVSLRARGRNGDWHEAFPDASIGLAGVPRIAGLGRPDGRFDVLHRARGPGDEAGFASLCITAAAGRAAEVATLQLLGPAAFVEATGAPAPPPLDPGAGYDGWRAP